MKYFLPLFSRSLTLSWALKLIQVRVLQIAP